MNKDTINQKINESISAITPDVYDKVANADIHCDIGGYALSQSVEQSSSKKKVVKFRTAQKFVAAAASLLILFSGGTMYMNSFAEDSIIGIDVNPSIELITNKSNKILDVHALNDDALEILDGMDLEKVDATIAVNAIIGSMVTNGYIDELHNTVLFTVENDDSKKAKELQDSLTQTTSDLLQALSIDSLVLAQETTSTKTPEVQALADQLNISYGKALMISSILEYDPNLDINQFSKLSLDEMALYFSNLEDLLDDTTAEDSTLSQYVDAVDDLFEDFIEENYTGNTSNDDDDDDNDDIDSDDDDNDDSDDDDDSTVTKPNSNTGTKPSTDSDDDDDDDVNDSDDNDNDDDDQNDDMNDDNDDDDNNNVVAPTPPVIDDDDDDSSDDSNDSDDDSDNDDSNNDSGSQDQDSDDDVDDDDNDDDSDD